MSSATADTNIYISGLQFGGIPQRFLDSAAEGDFRLDVSDAILSETLRILRDKFRWASEALRDAEQDIRSYTQLSTPAHTVDVIQADPSDNRILECAAAAKSDYIVTGDTRHLLPLGHYDGIPIVKVAEFMRRLQGKHEHDVSRADFHPLQGSPRGTVLAMR